MARETAPALVSTPNPEHSPHSFRVHTLNAGSLQEQAICLRTGYVAYDLVATRGGMTLMVELLVPTQSVPVGRD